MIFETTVVETKNAYTIEGSLLIMAFMGIVPNLYHAQYYVSRQPWLSVSGPTKKQVMWDFAGSSRYSTEWNWLMPVVEKIWDTIGNKASLWYFEVTENDEPMTIYSSAPNEAGCSSNTETCFSAVVNFIEWYNTQNK